MPKTSKKTKSPKKKGKKMQIKIKKPKIKFQKPSWENIKNSKVTKYSLYVLGILVFFVLVDFGVQYLNNGYSAAVVNGDRVTKREFYYRLDQAYGSSIVSQLIDEQLILQEAQKEGVEATDEEIASDLADITDQVGGEEQLNASLDAYNLTLDDLKYQIRLDILTRKMLEPTIEYTDEDVMSFFEDYSDVIFPEETAALEDGELLDYESHKEETKDVYLQQQVESAKTAWLSNLRTNAMIQNNVVDEPSYKFLGATRNIVTNLWEKINSNEASSTSEE